MISYNEASALIREEFDKIKPGTELIQIENALHRTLAEDIISDIFLPSFNNSAVDGYGIIFGRNMTEWKIIGEISAGNYKEFKLNIFDAVKIMTGAKIPDDVTAVIPIENVTVEDDKINLLPNIKYHSGMNIRKKGSDINKNEIAVKRGTFLKPRHLAAVAACGKVNLLVFKKLKFAILATGDELIPITEKPQNDKIRVSNTYSLMGEVLENHQLAVNYGFVNDDKNRIKEIIKKILSSDAEVVLTTGGVSVGEYDYLKTIFLELGVAQIFWRAYIKPGKPAYFGVHKKNDKMKLIFGLPGNPVSSQVNFKVYIKENVRRLYGMNPTETVKAELINDLRKKDKKRHFMKGLLTKVNDKYYVTSTISQSSGNLVEMSKANCLIIVKEEQLNPKKGEFVECIPM
ncbi:molybdopterin molybdenumtransferase [bacterium BMS3Abin04]|nr:molybdopterin molybdenumtransferase [bacterium BMS3Abin04]